MVNALQLHGTVHEQVSVHHPIIIEKKFWILPFHSKEKLCDYKTYIIQVVKLSLEIFKVQIDSKLNIL